MNLDPHQSADPLIPCSPLALSDHLDFDLVNLWDESKETIENMSCTGDNDLAAKMIKASAKAYAPGEPICAAVNSGGALAKKASAVVFSEISQHAEISTRARECAAGAAGGPSS